MRILVITLRTARACVATAACLATAACASRPARVPAGAGAADESEWVNSRARANVAAARELDREGVRSFREGRYADAIRYFRTAYRLGGPSSELWNVARTRERLDDPEGAVGAIEQYLAQRDLSAPDRAEAEREARGLRARPSVLTVTTTPPGAVVTVDGKPAAGPTPLSVEIPAGPHTIGVRHDGYAAESRPLEARFGRAVIVSLDLVPGAK
jgi:hypothetical protein